MKVLWHNDGLSIRPDNNDERRALAVILDALQKGDLFPEPAPVVGPDQARTR